MPSVASGRYFKTSPARLELLRRRRQAEGLAPAVPLATIARRDDAGRWPLSFSQERLWFLAQLEPDGASLNIPLAVRLRGRLDAGALARGLTEVCRRHEVLRAVFRSAGGRPEQRIAPPEAVALPRVDRSALPAAARESEEARLSRWEALRPFRLDRERLLRALLVVGGVDDHVLRLTVHHVVADGWSLGIPPPRRCQPPRAGGLLGPGASSGQPAKEVPASSRLVVLAKPKKPPRSVCGTALPAPPP